MTEPTTWEIAHFGLCVHDPKAADEFYRNLVGLAPDPSGAPHTFANGFQSLTLYAPDPGFARQRDILHNPRMTKVATLAVNDLGVAQARLDATGVAYSEIDGLAPGLGRELLSYDPSMNLIGFVQRHPEAEAPDEAPWLLHHVNLQAHEVRKTVEFFVGIADMTEGQWIAPPERGDFSLDPHELAPMVLGGENRGLHIIRPDAGFAQRNGFAHNPSIGGHPAFRVSDIHGVMARLDEAGVLYSNAGTYAMSGYHQVYVYDPSCNLIEINQRVG